MADEAVQNDGAAATAGKPLGGRLMLILGLAGALVIGLGAGVVLVGPMVTHRMSQPKAEKPEPAPAEEALPTYLVENVVLNPAETQGTRFLMASIAAKVSDEATVERLKERDAEVRDHLMSLLGSKTVTQLSDVASRDDLKHEIAGALEELAAPGTVADVYLPTFVIQ